MHMCMCQNKSIANRRFNICHFGNWLKLSLIIKLNGLDSCLICIANLQERFCSYLNVFTLAIQARARNSSIYLLSPVSMPAILQLLIHVIREYWLTAFARNFSGFLKVLEITVAGFSGTKRATPPIQGVR